MIRKYIKYNKLYTKNNIYYKKPKIGFEPTTLWLTATRSATELLGQFTFV